MRLGTGFFCTSTTGGPRVRPASRPLSPATLRHIKLNTRRSVAQSRPTLRKCGRESPQSVRRTPMAKTPLAKSAHFRLNYAQVFRAEWVKGGSRIQPPPRWRSHRPLCIGGRTGNSGTGASRTPGQLNPLGRGLEFVKGGRRIRRCLTSGLLQSRVIARQGQFAQSRKSLEIRAACFHSPVCGR